MDCIQHALEVDARAVPTLLVGELELGTCVFHKGVQLVSSRVGLRSQLQLQSHPLIIHDIIKVPCARESP